MICVLLRLLCLVRPHDVLKNIVELLRDLPRLAIFYKLFICKLKMESFLKS